MAGYVPKSFVPEEEAPAAGSGYVPKSFVPEPEDEGSDFTGMARAGLQGLYGSLGIDPAKAAAALEAFPAVTNPARSFKAEYDAALAENAPEYKRAVAAHPVAKAVGEIAPAMAAPASVPLQAGIGAVRGFATSEKTGAGRLGDAALDAGLSAAGTKAGNAISGWAAKGPLARWLGGKSAQATADQVAKEAAAKASNVASAAGSMGTPAAQVMRADEVIKATMQDMAPSSRVAAEAMLKSPEWTSRRVAAGERYLEQAPEYLAKFDESAEALKAAHAVDPAALAAEKLGSPWKNQVAPRLKKYGTRLAASYLGQQGAEAAGGGTQGQVAGSLLGWGAGAALGDPGTSLANMLKSPEFRKGAADVGAAGLKAAGAGAGRLARLLGVTSDDEAEALIRRFSDEQR